jgi:hypothetical protein
MLILAVLAITVGVGLLWMVLGRYDFEYTGPVSLLFSLPASIADAGAGSVIAGV